MSDPTDPLAWVSLAEDDLTMARSALRRRRRDLGHVLDVARKSLDSLWVSDHHMTADRYRLECWTQLTWIAARYPGPLLGTRRGPARVQIAPYRYTAWISARV